MPQNSNKLPRLHRQINIVYSPCYALYIAFFTMSNGLEKAYSSQLAAVVKSHSRTLGFIYNTQMRFGIFLSRFVPAKSAVRLVFAAFLIRRKWHERIIPQRIRKIHEKA